MSQLQVLQHPVNEFVLWKGIKLFMMVERNFRSNLRDVKSAFAVNSYCNILQKDFNEEISYIKA